MKWFLTICALASVLGIMSASCGPQRDFCPTKNPDPTDFTCHDNPDAITGMGGQNQGPCDGGPIFVCNGVTQCVACQ